MLVGEARLDLDTSEMFEGYLLKSDDLEGELFPFVGTTRKDAFVKEHDGPVRRAVVYGGGPAVSPKRYQSELDPSVSYVPDAIRDRLLSSPSSAATLLSRRLVQPPNQCHPHGDHCPGSPPKLPTRSLPSSVPGRRPVSTSL